MRRRDRWVMVLLVVAACGDDGTTPSQPNPAACPASYPDASYPAGCEPEVECRWAAEGCTPGALPDNVCRCSDDGASWVCESYFRNCGPDRREPEHRASPDACADPAAVSRDAPCASTVPDADTCSVNGDCAADALCLSAYTFGGDTACTCRTSGCLTDADCPADMLCSCGTVDGTVRCDLEGVGCGHRCVTATCRSDADCGPGGLCSPSFDVCGARVERWTCHQPADDECLTDAECVHVGGPMTRCRALAADTWSCTESPICD